MFKRIKNNKGLTLVEILAALVLLSIVLITFMSFFTQSAKFTAHNQETLTAVQIGEQAVSDIRGLETIFDIATAKKYEKKGNVLENEKSYEHFIVTIEE